MPILAIEWKVLFIWSLWEMQIFILKYSIWSQVLQKKQQNSKKLASLSIQNEKRANELEQSVDHMKYQKVQLQKRLREENEKRKQLDTEIQRDQQKIKVILSYFPAKYEMAQSWGSQGLDFTCEISHLGFSLATVLILFKALFNYIVKPIYWILTTVLKALTLQKKVQWYSLTVVATVKTHKANFLNNIWHLNRISHLQSALKCIIHVVAWKKAQAKMVPFHS